MQRHKLSALWCLQFPSALVWAATYENISRDDVKTLRKLADFIIKVEGKLQNPELPSMSSRPRVSHPAILGVCTTTTYRSFDRSANWRVKDSIQIPEGMDGPMKHETSARCHTSRGVKQSKGPNAPRED